VTAPRPEIVVRPLELESTSAAGAVLGRAFADNPGMVAVLAHMTRQDRHAALPAIKRGFASAAVRFGEARGAWDGERLVGASLTYAPGQYPLSLRGFAALASGCVSPRLLPATLRFLHINAWMEKRHEKSPHYYLMVLGVEPALQGKGVGGALLRELSSRADAARVPCWLETDKEENVPIYGRHGYVVVDDEVLPRLGGLRMWTMRRPASR
jgi:GNAT superfamily N-acetyltransferase